MIGRRAVRTPAKRSPAIAGIAALAALSALAAMVTIAAPAATATNLASPPVVAQIPKDASVPYPDFVEAEPMVRDQLLLARREHDALVASGSAGPAALAMSYGRLGELYHGYDLSEAAEAAYRRALELAPADFQWLYLLGFLEQTEGRREESVETLESALAIEPEDSAALLRLGDQELELGRIDSAERRYRRVLELDPTAAAALQGLGRVETDRGRHEAAISAFEQALTIAPYASRLHFLAGMAYRRAGNLERARVHLGQQGPTEVVFEDPLAARMRSRATGSAVTQHRGFLAQSAGYSDAALEAYRHAVAADPGNPEARRSLAGALQQRGEIDEAIEEFRNLLRIDSNPAAAHFMLGGALQQKGSLGEALGHFKTAVELEPDYRMFRFRLAEALVQGGDAEAAEEQFENLIELDARDIAAHLRLGELLARAEREAEALEHFEIVTRADAGRSLYAAAYEGKGRILAARGDTTAAVAAYSAALEVDPARVDTRFALANLRGREGEFSAAAEDYRLVIEQVSQHVPARLGEATALLLAGREAEALARLEEGWRELPTNPALAGALARLLAAGSETESRDGVRALEIALELYKNSGSLEHGETVAMALAELERFEEAIDWQSNLLAEAERQQNSPLIGRLRHNLDRYLRSEPARLH